MKRRLLLVVLLCATSVLTQPTHADIVFTVQKPRQDLYSFEQSVGLLGGDRRQGVRKPWWEASTRNIYTIQPDGANLRQLTDDGISSKPEWSLDGEWIAYIQGAPPREILMVMRKDGSDKRELLNPQVRILEFWWAPDSSALLVTVETRRGAESLEGQIVSLHGDRAKRLGNPEWAQGWNHWHGEKSEIVNPDPRLLKSLPEGAAWPEWSYSREYIAFIAEQRLSIANVESVSATQRWFAQQIEPPVSAIEEWSRDDTKVLFYVAGYVCVSTIVDGLVERSWNASRHPASDATFSRDGERIAFTSRQHGRENTEIYVMDVEGSRQVQITNTNYDHMELDWY